MIIRGKVVAKTQQEGGASFARIQVYKKKKTAAALMRIFDILDDGELNIGESGSRRSTSGSGLVAGLIDSWRRMKHTSRRGFERRFVQLEEIGGKS